MKQVSPDLLASALRQYPDPPEFAMPTETVGKYDYHSWANAIYAALPDQPDGLREADMLLAEVDEWAHGAVASEGVFARVASYVDRYLVSFTPASEWDYDTEHGPTTQQVADSRFMEQSWRDDDAATSAAAGERGGDA